MAPRSDSCRFVKAFLPWAQGHAPLYDHQLVARTTNFISAHSRHCEQGDAIQPHPSA